MSNTTQGRRKRSPKLEEPTLAEQVRSLLEAPCVGRETTLQKKVTALLSPEPKLTGALLKRKLRMALDSEKSKSGSEFEEKLEKLLGGKRKLTETILQKRLKEARERNQKLRKIGKLADPTKSWSDRSVSTLSKALSGK